MQLDCGPVSDALEDDAVVVKISEEEGNRESVVDKSVLEAATVEKVLEREGSDVISTAEEEDGREEVVKSALEVLDVVTFSHFQDTVVSKDAVVVGEVDSQLHNTVVSKGGVARQLCCYQHQAARGRDLRTHR